ncbi:hypothetical protein [Clostridium thermosuccinogenes]|uniref:hypothetical protein n=1 Tax=Clostridium thermosuccinogenes TaxID=84032 RepID=UPI001374FE99|nr:hypothetical protein [Pseudoclostridium thermosuccinogenes]
MDRLTVLCGFVFSCRLKPIPGRHISFIHPKEITLKGYTATRLAECLPDAVGTVREGTDLTYMV